jgi:unsaturated rhamnogalacturonyl hydrolase
MWLDGIYMAAPFYARFGANFGEHETFDDIALQVSLLNQHARDPHTGLFYHAWDASYSMPWADPQTGCSPHFWARAIGWFMMALSDLLDFIPRSHPQFDSLVQVYRECAKAVIHTQDPSSGVWYQVIDQSNRSGNYLEASASCMFVYALAKGYRQGFLAPDTIEVVLRAYQGILEQFVQVDERGWVNLHHICSVGGLGGEPYRDGSFDYYVSEKIVSNDYKGIGPFIMASLEIEALESHIDQAEDSGP